MTGAKQPAGSLASPAECNMTASAAGAHECREPLLRIVGGDHLRPATSGDAMDGAQPQWVIEPASAGELAQVLALANGSGLHVIARGGGTKLDWGNPPRGADLIVCTRRLDRVLEHAAGDMTATVQAGCCVAALNQRLAERGQRLAIDPLWPDRATIGGILATNDSGPLRAAFGTLRDHLIGITVALADGTLARSGGKVVKNVAGYDLPKLFTGSFGTLGVITEATFRLYPLARASTTLRFVAPSFEALGPALAAMAECSLITTAVQIEIEDDAPPAILILIEGLPSAIEEKVRRVSRAAERCELTMTDAPPDAWTARERLFADRDACVCKVNLLPTQWVDLCARLRGIDTRWRLIGQAVGVGLLRLQPNASETVTSLRRDLGLLGASLVVLRCPPALKRGLDAWGDVGDALPLMRRVKEQFDANGILAPGRFVGGI